jgi:hypothetical protein
VSAGISGVRIGYDDLRSESESNLVADSARDSLKLAVAGACLGLLPSCLKWRRSRVPGALALGALGSALGFCAGFTWKTRRLSFGCAHSAARELGRVSDDHWLEMHPIDYA